MKGLFRRKLCDDKLPHKRWTDIVPEVQLAMNKKQHSATKHSPFELLYGETKNTNFEERGYMKKKYIDEAKTNLHQTAAQMKKQYDKKSSETELNIGDKVYVKRNFVKKGASKKLSTMFYDLSDITECNHPIYKIKSISTQQEKWVHHNRLRKKGTLEDEEQDLNPKPKQRGTKQNIKRTPQ